MSSYGHTQALSSGAPSVLNVAIELDELSSLLSSALRHHHNTTERDACVTGSSHEETIRQYLARLRVLAVSCHKALVESAPLSHEHDGARRWFAA